MRYVLYNFHAGHGTDEEKLAKLNAAYPNGAALTDITKIESYEAFFGGLSPEDTVILCGGDGTLNRFVNDTVGLDIKNEIFYRALGTGNDFLKDIEADEDSDIALSKYIKHLPTVEIDGKTYRFLNNVGFGIDGYCCEVGDAMKAAGKTDINYTSIAIGPDILNLSQQKQFESVYSEHIAKLYRTSISRSLFCLFLYFQKQIPYQIFEHHF